MALDVYFKDDIANILTGLAAGKADLSDEYERGYLAALFHVGLSFGLRSEVPCGCCWTVFRAPRAPAQVGPGT